MTELAPVLARDRFLSPALADCGRVECARIMPRPDGRFFWGGKVEALYLPVAGPLTWDAPKLGPIWVNVVAWTHGTPNKWWLEVADWPLLGWHALQEAMVTSGAILLHPTPAAWVASGGRGCCVLSWRNFDVGQWFHGVKVICADAAIERRLHRELARGLGLDIERAKP